MHVPSIAFMVILLVIVLVLFGGGKVAKLGGELGTAIREFRNGLNGGENVIGADAKIKNELPPPPTI